MSRNRLSALDAAFLSLESADAPMHVGWAAVFGPPADGSRPDFETVRDHIESRLGRAPRYRQRLLEIPFGLDDPVWVDDPDFDLSRHVLKAPHGDFESLVDEVMSTPLEHGRPLWELWIAERLDDDRIGVVGKAHHCLVDGLAAVELMSLLLDVTPDPQPIEADDWTPEDQPGSIELVGEAIGHQLGQALDLSLVPLAWARNPGRLLDLPGQAWSAARAVVHAAKPLAPPSRINGAMTGRRHLALLSRPLDDLRTIKNHFGTTINDVLLSASAGSLRDLLDERDEPSVSREIKAMVPVSVQDPDDRWGNGIAFLFLPLPTDEADPVWRLRDIHVAMRERKREHEPEGSDAVLGALSLAPRGVRRLASRVLASPALSNLTISNIPGPRVPLYLLGCEALRAYPVVPLTGGHGISIGMTTVHDEACFGVYAQAELADDADRIAAGIDRALDELLALTRA